MVHADADPAQVGAHVVDPVRNGLAELGVDEVVDPHLWRLSLGMPLPSGVLEVADQFFLLGIDGDHWLIARLEVPHAGGDVLELGIAVRMLATFACLARPLQAVVGFMEQVAHHLRADLMPLRPKLLREPPHALACPAQRRLWIPPCGRLHQRFEIREQGRVVLNSPLAASASAAAPSLAAAWYGRRLTAQLLDTRVDRRPRQACRLGHNTDPPRPSPMASVAAHNRRPCSFRIGPRALNFSAIGR